MKKLSSVLLDGESLNKLKIEGENIYSLPKLTREELENLLEPEERVSAWPELEKLLNEYFQLRDQSGKHKEKIAVLDDIIDLPFDNFLVWFEKGKWLSESGEHNKAIECFEKALVMCPKDLLFPEPDKNIKPHFIRAEIFFSLGAALSMSNVDQHAPNIETEQHAIECFDKAIELDPNNPNAWGVKGNAVSKLAVIEKNESRRKRMYEESIECYDKSFEINPNPAVLCGKGVILCLLGKKEEALVCLDKVIEMDPNSKEMELVKKLKKDYDLGT